MRPAFFLKRMVCTCMVLGFLICPAWADPVIELQPGQVRPETLDAIFSGNETLHYTVSWSGGLKIGDILMEIRPAAAPATGYVISAHVKDYGALATFYPIDDQFRCTVDGAMKLPTRYEVIQREGHRHHLTTRVTEYDQQQQQVRYQKNKNPIQTFALVGKAYNEFASFIITRALSLQINEPIVVPTFADEKRHEVRVYLLKREELDSIFGKRQTLKIEPRLQFKGLYEKSGSTLLWVTDDRCRVPVEIRSRIALGSLVAELTDYTNKACPELVRLKHITRSKKK